MCRSVSINRVEGGVLGEEVSVWWVVVLPGYEFTGNRKTGGWDRTDGFSMCPLDLCRRFQPLTG